MDEIWCVPTAESRLRLVCGVVVSHGDGGCPLSSHPRPDSIRHTLLGAQSPVLNRRPLPAGEPNPDLMAASLQAWRRRVEPLLLLLAASAAHSLAVGRASAPFLLTAPRRAVACAPRMAAAPSDDADGDGKVAPLLSLKSGPGIDPVESDEDDAVTDPRLRTFDVGPFATTIGLRDRDAAEEPNFLQREDWSVVSTYSAEELAALSREALETKSGAEAIEEVTEVETAEYVEPQYKCELRRDPPRSEEICRDPPRSVEIGRDWWRLAEKDDAWRCPISTISRPYLNHI